MSGHRHAADAGRRAFLDALEKHKADAVIEKRTMISRFSGLWSSHYFKSAIAASVVVLLVIYFSNHCANFA